MEVIGNVIAVEPFRRRYGNFINEESGYQLTPSWQFAVNQASTFGCFVYVSRLTRVGKLGIGNVADCAGASLSLAGHKTASATDAPFKWPWSRSPVSSFWSSLLKASRCCLLDSSYPVSPLAFSQV